MLVAWLEVMVYFFVADKVSVIHGRVFCSRPIGCLVAYSHLVINI